MNTVRNVILQYLMEQPLRSVTGENGRTIQNQGYDDGEGPIWAYDEDGEPVGSMGIYSALDYIGI